MTQLKPNRFIWPTLGVIALFAAPALADELADMAGRLSSLRGEVETLSATLSEEASDGRDRLRSLSRQKAELELEIKKEQTRTAKLRQLISKRRKEVQDAKTKDSLMAPLFEKEIVRVRDYVNGTLPFRTADRLTVLEKLEAQYKGGTISAPKAVSRLWAFMEDEFRLTRENGLYQQSIKIDGSHQLAEIVRIGMVMLYFKVDDDTFGRAVREGSGWTFQKLETPEDKKELANLFVSFKKQIRQGFFQIPNALPALSSEADLGAAAKDAPTKAQAQEKALAQEPAQAEDAATKQAEEPADASAQQEEAGQ
ncbi:MAG: DUF3450 domain-containing protein [Polyangiaceae bacterium]|nr:DUF3450 domain-containing protein [Polyangiaceae bacterium]